MKKVFVLNNCEKNKVYINTFFFIFLLFYYIYTQL
jgi:hypothetical protein